MDDKKGRRRESRFYKTQKRRMDRSDQYPDLAECKHGFVRRRIYSVILGRVDLLARTDWFFVFPVPRYSVKCRSPYFGGIRDCHLIISNDKLFSRRTLKVFSRVLCWPYWRLVISTPIIIGRYFLGQEKYKPLNILITYLSLFFFSWT